MKQYLTFKNLVIILPILYAAFQQINEALKVQSALADKQAETQTNYSPKI